MQIDFRDLAPFALLAPIIAFWSQFKSYMSTLRSLVIRTDTVYLDDIYYAVLRRVASQGRIIRFGDTTWLIFSDYLKSLGIDYMASFADEAKILVLYRGFIPVWFTAGQNSKVTYLARTFNLEALLREEELKMRAEAMSAAQKDMNKRYFRYREVFSEISSGFDRTSNSPAVDKSDSPSPSKAPESSGTHTHNIYQLREHARLLVGNWSDIGRVVGKEVEPEPAYFWTPEALALRKEISYFINHSEWFMRKHLRYQRGALLYGQPGTGKTKMVFECCQAERMPIVHIHASGMSNREFRKVFDNMGEEVGLVLMEDIDCVFDGRQNQQAGQGGMLLNPDPLTLDTLLDCLGRTTGRRQGVFVLMTTNHKDRLDPALLRPGRLDLHLEVGVFPEDGRRHVATHIVGDTWPHLVDVLVTKGRGQTAAEFENLCIDTARTMIQEKKAV